MDNNSIRLPGQILYKFTCPNNLLDFIRSYSLQIQWDKVPRRGNTDNSGRSYLHDSFTSLHLIKELEPLHAWIDDCLNDVNKKVEWDKTACLNKIKISQSWLNCSMPGEEHHLHNHPLSLLSAILYIQGKAETTFQFNSLHSLPAILGCKPEAVNKFFCVNCQSQLGTLLVFPSTLLHKVGINNDKVNRITMSFNSWFEGGVGQPKTLAYIP